MQIAVIKMSQQSPLHGQDQLTMFSLTPSTNELHIVLCSDLLIRPNQDTEMLTTTNLRNCYFHPALISHNKVHKQQCLPSQDAYLFLPITFPISLRKFSFTMTLVINLFDEGHESVYHDRSNREYVRCIFLSSFGITFVISLERYLLNLFGVYDNLCHSLYLDPEKEVLGILGRTLVICPILLLFCILLEIYYSFNCCSKVQKLICVRFRKFTWCGKLS